jgi:membrane protein
MPKREPIRKESAGVVSFFRQLLPKEFEMEDLLIVLLLLLMAGDSQENQNTALLTLVLYLSGTTLLDYLWMTTHPALMVLLRLVDLRAVLLLVMQTILFTCCYAFLPAGRNTLRQSFPGAVFTALGWMIFSKLFSVYVEHFRGYSSIYGSVYAVALSMLWLYFCLSILFYGGALNRLLMEPE